MAQATRAFIFRRKAADEHEIERQILLDGMAQARRGISEAYQGFNSTRDPDLIESYVYEINSLESRYSYLLRRVRELEQPAAGR